MFLTVGAQPVIVVFSLLLPVYVLSKRATVSNRRLFLSINHAVTKRLFPAFCEECDKRIDPESAYEYKYCSQCCFLLWHKKNSDASTLARCVCENCAQAFLAKQDQVEKGWARYCSRECKKEHGRAYCTCWQCEKGFHTPINQVMNGGGKFCSRKCKDAWLKDHPPTHQLPVMCGADHPNYRGGYKGNYYGPNWFEQRRNARKRAGHKCECCGKTRKQNKAALDVHHVKAFRSFNYVPDVNSHYLEANRLDNLIAVCRSCHRRIEMGTLSFQPYLL